MRNLPLHQSSLICIAVAFALMGVTVSSAAGHGPAAPTFTATSVSTSSPETFSLAAHLATVYGHAQPLDVTPLTLHAAVQALDGRLGPSRSPAEVDVALDGLDPDLANTIATLLSAVVAAHEARVRAYDGLGDDALLTWLGSETDPEAARAIETVDTHLLQRAALAVAIAVDEAIPLLQQHAATRPLPLPSLATGLPPAVDLAPVVVIDPDGVDNLHTRDAILVVDLGGNDVYATNAGGALIHQGLAGDPASCQYHAVGTGVDCDNEDALVTFSTALLVDMDGDDTYGVYQPPRANSRDATCTSDPIIRRVVVQGSGSGGIGMLVDRAGADAYRGKTLAQGNGHLAGVGALFDLAGDDTYDAIRSAMGSSVLGGTGSLYDGAGADRYTFTAPAGGLWNVDRLRCDDTARLGLGAAALAGTGHFLDVAGDDVYRIDSQGLGHAAGSNAASFVDAAGRDDYGVYPGRGNDETVTGPGLFVDMDT